MNKKALPYYTPGIILALWGGLWGITGFYTSQTIFVIALLFGGLILLWLGQRVQKQEEGNSRDTFGEQ